jgi:multiple sugar transport system permease protein
MSLFYAFTHYTALEGPVNAGFSNFTKMANDEVFWKSLKNTFIYAAMALPAGLFLSLGLALLLNVQVPGQSIFRTIVFLPSLTPAAAGAYVWMYLLNTKQGIVAGMLDKIGVGVCMVIAILFIVSLALVVVTILNGKMPSRRTMITMMTLGMIMAISFMLEVFGSSARVSAASVESPKFWEVDWVLKTFAMLSVWGVGNTVVIYLAGLQDVPKELYEAAEIDGASTLRRLWHVTLPTLSPVIFFNLIIAIIGALQQFTGPYLITQGGPNNASMFLSIYVYMFAFQNYDMGYASAMAWIQLLMVLALTGIAFWTSKRWVHYQGK